MNAIPFDLNDLYFFTEVVDRHGFGAAAAAIGATKSRLSRRIALLEEVVGTRLLQRSTRRLELTEAGREFYQHCVKLVEQARAANLAMQNRATHAVGTIRMSVTVAVADWLLVEVLPKFLEAYPKVQVALQATNQYVDLLDEQVDIAVRGMKVQPDPSEVVQTGFCTVRWGLFASPAYLASQGGISMPADLSRSVALVYRTLDEIDPAWNLTTLTDETPQLHQAPVRLQSDNLGVLKRAALAGLGVCELPLYACRGELATGTLVHVLPDMRPRHGRLAVLFPTRSGMTPAVRLLVEFLKTQIPPLLRRDEVVGDALPGSD